MYTIILRLVGGTVACGPEETVLAAILGLDVGSARYAIGHAGRDPYPLAAIEQEVPDREVAAGRGQSGAFPLVLVVAHQG